MSALANLKLQQPLKEKKGSLVTTLNKMGYMTLSLDPYSEEFTDHAATLLPSTPSLEIGAAYGIATLPALEKGATIIANDLSYQHLKILHANTPSHLRQNLTLMPGRFPYEVTLAPQSLGAVLSSRVIHFFSPQEVEDSLKLIFNSLVPFGKLFIISETPYLRDYKEFIPVFEKRKRQKNKWPGLIEDIGLYQPKKMQNIPKQLHFFDADTLSAVVSNHGFIVEKVSMFERSDYSPDLRLDGRESVGIVAYKPGNRPANNNSNKSY